MFRQRWRSDESESTIHTSATVSVGQRARWNIWVNEVAKIPQLSQGSIQKKVVVPSPMWCWKQLSVSPMFWQIYLQGERCEPWCLQEGEPLSVKWCLVTITFCYNTSCSVRNCQMHLAQRATMVELSNTREGKDDASNHWVLFQLQRKKWSSFNFHQ